MTKSSIRYIVISDIHLGHPRNSTEGILKALDRFFNNYAARDDLDIIFLAGDVFDRLLDLPSPEVSEITTWVHRLIMFCSRNMIKLRILEGTPSHDWGQSIIFKTALDVMGGIADVKYINALSIEYMTDLDLHVLYVPDEWHNSTDKIFEDVKAQLASMQISQVDIAIMHGSFAYQLPVQAIKSPKHKESDYLSIVKYFISIGHVHTHSVYERIVAQGSFDRLAHGEEEPKGGVEFTINVDGTGSYCFIENTLAKIFKTITLRSQDIDASINTIGRQTQKLPHGSYIRIRAKKNHPAIVGFDELKKRFPFFTLSKITTESEDDVSHQLIDDVVIDDSYVPITITRDNVQSLLMEAVLAKHQLSQKQHDIAIRAIQDVL